MFVSSFCYKVWFFRVWVCVYESVWKFARMCSVLVYVCNQKKKFFDLFLPSPLFCLCMSIRLWPFVLQNLYEWLSWLVLWPCISTLVNSSVNKNLQKFVAGMAGHSVMWVQKWILFFSIGQYNSSPQRHSTIPHLMITGVSRCSFFIRSIWMTTQSQPFIIA